MIKSEFVKKLADKNPHLYVQDVDRIVNFVLDEITTALQEGSRVELRGLGAFTVKSHKARLGRDLRNGTAVDVGVKHIPAFRCLKDLHKRLKKPEAIAQEKAGSFQLDAGAAVLMASVSK